VTLPADWPEERRVSLAGDNPVTGLLADTERLDDSPVTIDILGFEIIEEPPPLANQHEQAPPRMVVLVMDLEVLGKIRDSLREERDLNLGRARVTRLSSKLLNNLCFTFCC
jgi:hypothetical protein